MNKYYLISEQIDNDIPVNEKELNEFIILVNNYLNNININNIEALYSRGSKITPKATYNFFRSQNRINNAKLIIQYLLSFLEKIPLEEDIEKEEINPFKQFKLFIIRAMKLLRERDVRDAILHELETIGVLNDNNLWYYRGRIDLVYKEVYKLLKSVKDPKYLDYKMMLLAIKALSKFWFAQRNESIKQIRKSDFYSYKLASILIDRINSTTEIDQTK